jgi:hypothetical protein
MLISFNSFFSISFVFCFGRGALPAIWLAIRDLCLYFSWNDLEMPVFGVELWFRNFQYCVR